MTDHRSQEPKVEWARRYASGPYDPDAIRWLNDGTEGLSYVSASGTLVHIPRRAAGLPGRRSAPECDAPTADWLTTWAAWSP